MPFPSSTFDFKSQDKSIWFVGLLALVVVWSLFIIVTVVYSEVILEVIMIIFSP